MKKKDLFDVISNIDPNIITESEGKVRTRPAAIGAAIAATACALALCIGIGALYPIISKRATVPTETGAISTEQTAATARADDQKGEIINLSSSSDVQRAEGKAPDERFKKAYFDFSVELLKEQLNSTEEKNQNTLLSPLSAMYAMTMIANGAAGDTLAEMESALGRGLNIDELNEYLCYLFSDLCTEGSGVTTANSIWFRDINDITVSDAYLNKNALYHKAEIFKAPFNNDTKDAINAWASDNTDGMIQEVLTEIPPDARLYIMNALLFKAKWEEKFWSKDENKNFTDADGNVHKVSMLIGDAYDRLYDINADGVIKNYDNGYSFFALLPKEGITAEDYVSSLTGQRLYDILNNAKEVYTVTCLPEFTTDYDDSLVNALMAMGIEKAFDGSEYTKADFSKMATVTDAKLYLSQVEQFTKIEVTAEGTEAAAVTVGGMEVTTSSVPTPPDIIRFDRPFVYGIMKDDGTVLFTGVQNTMD